MPRIITLHAQETAGVDLTGIWRIGLGTTTVVTSGVEQYALAVVYRYIPAQSALLASGDRVVSMMPYAKIPLARSIMDFATNAEAVQRIADVALGQGRLEDDLNRVTEAMKMFNNLQPSPRQQALTDATEEAKQIVSAWWWIRDWIHNGMMEKLSGKYVGTDIHLIGG